MLYRCLDFGVRDKRPNITLLQSGFWLISQKADNIFTEFGNQDVDFFLIFASGFQYFLLTLTPIGVEEVIDFVS